MGKGLGINGLTLKAASITSNAIVHRDEIGMDIGLLLNTKLKPPFPTADDIRLDSVRAFISTGLTGISRIL
jgi:hypothetical protein